MNTRHLYRIVIFVFLVSGLGFLKSAASQEELNSHLQKYLDLAKRQESSRIFKYTDGFPMLGIFDLTDQFGMQWYTRGAPTKLYAFTGVDFINILQTNNISKSDSIAQTIQTTDKTPYLQGKKHVYKWNGYKLIAYKFPVSDKIQTIKPSTNNAVYCYGKLGYGVLTGDNWTYRKYRNLKFNIEKEIIGFQLEKSDSYISIVKNPKKQDLIEFYILRQGVISVFDFSDYYKPFSKAVRYSCSEIDSTHTCIAKIDSKELYIVDVDKKTIKRIAVNSSGRIINLASHDDSTFDIITLQNSGKVWKSEVFSLKVESGEPQLTVSLEFPSRKLDYKKGYVSAWKGKLYDYQDNSLIFYKDTAVDKSKDNEMLYTNLETKEVGRIVFPAKIIWVMVNDETECIVLSEHPEYPGIIQYSALHLSSSNKLETMFAEFVKTKDEWRLIFSHRNQNTLSYVSSEGLEILPIVRTTKQIFPHVSPPQQRNLLITSDSSKHRIFKLDKTYIVVTIQQNSSYERIVFSKLTGKTIEPLNSYTEVISQAQGGEFNWKNIKPVYDEGKLYFKGNNKWLVYDSKSNAIKETNLDSVYIGLPTASLLRNEKGVVASLRSLVVYPYKLDWNNILTEVNMTDKIPRDAVKSLNWTLHSKDNVFDESGSTYIIGNGEYGYDRDLQGWGEGYYKPDVMPQLSFSSRGAGRIYLSHPTLSYNLQTGRVVPKPNWLYTMKNDNDEIFTFYKTKPGQQGTMTIRHVVNGVAMQTKNDPVIDFQDFNNEFFQYYSIENGIIVRLGKKLFCNIAGVWQKYVMPDRVANLDVSNAARINNKVFIGFPSYIAKLSQDNMVAVYGATHGVPEGDNYLYEVNQSLIICNAENIYDFSEPPNSSKIILPGYTTTIGAFSSRLHHSFNFKTNTFRFPVYILNTLYPEKCILEYQLKGFNDAPVRIPFTKEIRFDNLKPGSYSFSYTATTETGQKVHSPIVKFTIRPPFYSTWLAYLIYVLLGSVAIYGIFKLRTRQLKRQNLALETTVELRTTELKERQQRIQESIEYASLIQKSILPQREELIQRFRQHFVIWKPRDIVGGDFYWLYENEAGDTFFAVIDCTGHGVPGALLSMTVNSLLDKLVKDGGICSPAEILTRMHREIGAALHQTEAQTQQDGIEIALIKINPSSQTLTFSGGGLHLLHYDPESKDTSHLRGNKHGLGGLKWHAELVFDEQVIPYAEKQRIYLYTDGILDQPVTDTEKPKRLGSVAWLEFLGSIAALPMEEQETSCNELICRMLACHEQRDDITVVGIEL